MKYRRVFVSELDKEIVALDASQENYIKNVLRLRSGAHILLFDGSGNECEAEILSGSPLQVKILNPSITHRDLPIKIVMSCALPKGKRAEFMFAKLCELGVAEFIPLKCDRGIVKMSLDKKSRFERIAIESSKQCGRSAVTKVCPEATFDELSNYDLSFIALPNAKKIFLEELKFEKMPKDVLLIVGPEGGFTLEEERESVARGAIPVKLCPTILRIETAAIAFVSIFVNYVEKISLQV